jgi:cytochrome b pre-mRNA-processing protein 3
MIDRISGLSLFAQKLDDWTMLSWFRNRKQRETTAQNIYGSIVAQARKPDFYAKLHVPDSLEGRFEILLIHVFLATHALQAADRDYAALTTRLVELFISDIDATMRELGVSDMRVSKKMHVLTDVFYSRMHVYRDAIAGKEGDGLATVLLEHVYLDKAAHRGNARALASYMLRSARKLRALMQKNDASLNVDFAPIFNRGRPQSQPEGR